MLADTLYETTYRNRMRDVMMELREAIEAYAPDLDLPPKVEDMSGDDYEWAFWLKPTADSPREHTLYVGFHLHEQAAFEGEGDGITFAMDLNWDGGLIAGGMAPGNYTDACWLTDPAEIEDRFQLFETPQFFDETARFVVGLMENPPE